MKYLRKQRGLAILLVSVLTLPPSSGRAVLPVSFASILRALKESAPTSFLPSPSATNWLCENVGGARHVLFFVDVRV